MQSQRRLDIRTLAIASVASATAAALTSQFWIKGTPIAAAVTPVVVALISEMLHRPTERLTQRRAADSGPLPEAAGAAGSPPREETVAEAAARQEAAPPAGEPPERAYRRPRGRRIAVGAALVTGALAFATAALALSVPELITGQSLFNSDRRTTLGGAKVAPPQESPPADSEPTAPRPAPDGDRRPGEPAERRREQRPRQQPRRQQQQDQPQQRTTPETTPPPTTPTDTEEVPMSRGPDPSETAAPGMEAEPILR